MKKILGLLAMSGLFISAVPAPKPPTFVLVHGALFTGSGWSRLQSQLQDRGYNVVTLDIPGRSGDGIDPKTITIDTAAKKVCKVVALQKMPVILVGHSQGGAVITQAAGDCGRSVKGLVFVAAVAPKNGQIAFAGLDPKRDTNFGLCVDQDAAGGLFKLKRSGPLESSFFQDLRPINAELADQVLASMVSEPLGIGTTPLHFDEKAVGKIAKFYIESTADQVVSIETQRNYQKSWPFVKVYSHPTSHSGFLSQPKDIADDLIDAASRVK